MGRRRQRRLQGRAYEKSRLTAGWRRIVIGGAQPRRARVMIQQRDSCSEGSLLGASPRNVGRHNVSLLRLSLATTFGPIAVLRQSSPALNVSARGGAFPAHHRSSLLPFSPSFSLTTSSPTTSRTPQRLQNVQERVRCLRFYPQSHLNADCELPCSVSAGAKTKVKSSVQRGIRTKVAEQYPLLEPYLETIIPKKEQLDLVKLYVATSFIPFLPALNIIRLLAAPQPAA